MHSTQTSLRIETSLKFSTPVISIEPPSPFTTEPPIGSIVIKPLSRLSAPPINLLRPPTSGLVVRSSIAGPNHAGGGVRMVYPTYSQTHWPRRAHRAVGSGSYVEHVPNAEDGRVSGSKDSTNYGHES